MGSAWGIHGRRPAFEMVLERLIALERPGIGNMHAIGDDRGRVERALRASYPNGKDGTIRNWTTVLLRFAFGPAVVGGTRWALERRPLAAKRTAASGRAYATLRSLTWA